MDVMIRDYRNDVLFNILVIVFGYIGKLELLGCFFLYVVNFVKKKVLLNYFNLCMEFFIILKDWYKMKYYNLFLYILL